MARVTVEDCIVEIPNRFELVMVAAQRGREIAAGGSLTVDRDNDKNPVVALREIAEKTVSIDELSESLVRERQRHVEMDDSEDDIIDLMAGEEEFLQQSLAADAAAQAVPEDEISEDEVDLLLAAVEGRADAPSDADADIEGNASDPGEDERP
ncbi:MAG: DNA-directed RNA polymerase subunit omega [Inquilinaceae bacterium]